MCGPVAESVGNQSSGIAVLASSNPATQASSPTSNVVASRPTNTGQHFARVFHSKAIDGLYVLTVAGAVLLLTEAGATARASAYENESEINYGIEGGDLVELTTAEPVTVEPTLEHLQLAAQAQTGFKTGDIARIQDDGSFGRIIGFGQINVPDGIERVVLLETQGDAEGTDIQAFDESQLDLAGTLS